VQTTLRGRREHTTGLPATAGAPRRSRDQLPKTTALTLIIPLLLSACTGGKPAVPHGGSPGTASHQAEDRYRAALRPMLEAAYDDAQSLEIALAGFEQGPVRVEAEYIDLMRTGQLASRVRQQSDRAARLAVPPTLTSAARPVTDALKDVADAVAGFPRTLSTRTLPQLEGAQASLDTANASLATALLAVYPSGTRPPVAGPAVPGEVRREPAGPAAFIVATAHVCGPARKVYDAVSATDPQSVADTIKRVGAESALVARLYADLLVVPLPEPSQASIRASLTRQPSLPAVESEVLSLLRTDAAKAESVRPAFHTAAESARMAARGLASAGSATCANLLTDLADES
jgi:hypothetical protein